MEVKKTNTTATRTTAEIILDIPTSAKEDVGDYLLEQALIKVASQRSPITGDSFPKLSRDYRKEKIESGLPGIPNLESTGDMLDALDYRITGYGIEFGVFGPDAKKADGHNNLSGDSRLPTRQFIPAEGEGFTSEIEKEVARIIADATAVDPEESEDLLEAVESSASLYDVLRGAFNLESRIEIRLAVLRSPAWFSKLTQLGLIRWL